MPVFHMPEGHELEPSFADLDSFTRGYIEAMFFTDTCHGDLDDTENRDGEIPDFATYDDIDERSLWEIIAECASFKRANQVLIDAACDAGTYDEQRAGSDFWFTRNGHGVGFWDRDLGFHDELGDIGTRLSEACGWCTDFPEVYVHTGDDGKIYH